MAFTEDLTPFFDTVNGFAETVTYQGSTSIAVIFDNAFIEDRLGAVGIESTKPACLVRTSQVSSVVQGHTIARGAVNYQVASVHPDGTGLTLLVLEKQ